MACLPAVGAFACGADWSLDGWGGSARGGVMHARFGRVARVEAVLLLLSCPTAITVALQATKFLLHAIQSQLYLRQQRTSYLHLQLSSIHLGVTSRLEVVDTT